MSEMYKIIEGANLVRPDVETREATGAFNAGINTNNCISSTDADSVAKIIDEVTSFPKQLTDTLQDQMADACSKIRERVIKGEPDSLEILADQRLYRHNGDVLPLGATAIHFRIWDEKARDKFLIMDDSHGPPPIRFFIGGKTMPAFSESIPPVPELIPAFQDNTPAFLAISDKKEGKEYIVRLAEFHMVSVSKTSKPGREIGLVTSYTAFTGKFYTSPVMAENLMPIKQLLFSNFIARLQTKPQESSHNWTIVGKGGEDSEQKG